MDRNPPRPHGRGGDGAGDLPCRVHRPQDARGAVRNAVAKVRSIAPGENGIVARLRSELERYFSGRLKRFSVPLEYPGTEFQVRVWRALLDIPFGETRSYEDVARALGKPGAVRAVGHANGLNRIAIVIPCHRVVNKNGELGGYGGGLWRKKHLLALERGLTRGVEIG
jgi:O-6-methylguanine DNA methyltransferase